MRIYFAGSIRGGRKDVALYHELIEFLKNFGEVLTEHVGNQNLSHSADDGVTDLFIHNRDMEWLNSSDVVIAEVTTVSMGVGYEIGRAVSAGKKVICLYRVLPGEKISAMILGCPEIELTCYNSLDEAKQKITQKLSKYQSNING
jgi:2'-deoxynucleoside 5'-phosphate N-hydrolase